MILSYSITVVHRARRHRRIMHICDGKVNSSPGHTEVEVLYYDGDITSLN